MRIRPRFTGRGRRGTGWREIAGERASVRADRGERRTEAPMAGGPDNLLFVTSVHSRSSLTHAHPTLLRHSLANSHMLKHLGEPFELFFNRTYYPSFASQKHGRLVPCATTLGRRVMSFLRQRFPVCGECMVLRGRRRHRRSPPLFAGRVAHSDRVGA